MGTETLAMCINIITLIKIYLGASVITAIMFVIDKQLAIGQSYRISEKHLILASAACGWPGGLLAMKLVRHKTQKGSFQVLMGLAIVANVTVLVWVFNNKSCLSY